jgi:hypothetical protein
LDGPVGKGGGLGRGVSRCAQRTQLARAKGLGGQHPVPGGGHLHVRVVLRVARHGAAAVHRRHADDRPVGGGERSRAVALVAGRGRQQHVSPRVHLRTRKSPNSAATGGEPAAGQGRGRALGSRPHLHQVRLHLWVHLPQASKAHGHHLRAPRGPTGSGGGGRGGRGRRGGTAQVHRAGPLQRSGAGRGWLAGAGGPGPRAAAPSPCALKGRCGHPPSSWRG